MADRERRDIQTRFKEGQSGNPKGRPKGRKNNAGLLSDAFFKTVRIKDAEGIRNVPKIVAAAEVCLNNALKGDLRSFVKVMDVIKRPSLPPPIGVKSTLYGYQSASGPHADLHSVADRSVRWSLRERVLHRAAGPDWRVLFSEKPSA